MKFNEIFENEVIVEFGSKHAAPRRGAQAFSQGAYQQFVTWLGEIEDHDVRMFIANMAADIYEADNPKFKRELFLRKAQEGQNYGSNFRWQQRHYWAFANAIKGLPSQHMRDYIGEWLGDKFEDQRARSDEWRGFRRNLWDSACGIEGSNPKIAQDPHSSKYRNGEDDED